MAKYWLATIEDLTFQAPTLKALALLLKIKPSLIEGVYYRKRLHHKIKIEKVNYEPILPPFYITHEPFILSFD